MSVVRVVVAIVITLSSAFVRAEQLSVSLGPMEQVNLTPEQGQHFQRVLQRVVRGTAGLTLGRSLATLPCELREGVCLRRLRQQLDVQRLLVLRVGRLADTTVIRLTVYDLIQATRQGSWQDVLRRGTASVDEQRALQRMVHGFAPPPPAPLKTTRWYRRWWVWTIAGAVVAGSVTAVVLATRPGDGPDVTIRPF